MTIANLMSHLQNLDVRLWIEGDRLRYSAPEGALTPALRAELAERKSEVLAFLRQATTAAQAGPGFTAPPMVRADRSRPLPLSFAQQRLWFIDQLEPGTPLYNISFGLRFTGQLDITAVENSFGEIVRRHEVLRTCFASRDGEPEQVIAAHQPFHLEVVDISAEPESERDDSRVGILALNEAQQPFDLSALPLFRTKLLRMADDRHVLLVTMHHIISDGWSVGILVNEFSALYEAFLSGRSAGLADLPAQYADFAVWQKSWLQGEVLDRQLDYWRKQLNSVATLELPTDFPRPAASSHRGDVVDF
ncbi:MAG TPA: condensation domain-containing protein, partial [Blastocatellia bacterium]|nr:condensation domain-containing protein [Blastocatellia bacterium]